MSANPYYSNALAYVNAHIRYMPTAVDPLTIARHLADLCQAQEERAMTRQPPLREPLLWLALAMSAGLAVNAHGAIIAGPQIPGEGPCS